jgi:iron(III) transport system ATP-binding protein
MTASPRSPDTVLEMSGVCQAYVSELVVDNVSLRLDRGEIACLLGPSGCGKTSVLRTIAGFEPVVAGTIRLQGAIASEPGRTRPPEHRRIGMVFQDYALFPHLTIARNIGFGLRTLPRQQRTQRVGELLRVIRLEASAERYPHELSGGQQQRVALARALAPRPELLLLDEPFSNLDVDLRERLSIEVRAILKAAGATAVLVTHDQHEAFAMADVIGVMNRGRIEQWDTAYNLYHRPATRFVADFVGEGVLVPGTMTNPQEVVIEIGPLRSRAPLDCWRPGVRNRLAVDVLLRPDDVVHDERSLVRAQIVHKAFRGAEILYTLRLQSGARLLWLAPSHDNHAVGEWIGIRIELDQLVAFAVDDVEPSAARVSDAVAHD